VWAEGYFWGKAVHRAFDHFWANDQVLGKGLQDHLGDVWQMLARRYGNQPALFGWDILNEPFPGSLGGKVFRTLVGKLVRTCLVSPTVQRVKFLRNVTHKETQGRALDVLTPAVMEKVTSAAQALVARFEQEHYAPFVARMQRAIRAVTQRGVLIVEHNYFSNLGIPFTAPLPKEEQKLCYSPHGYDFMVDTPAYEFANDARVGFIFGRAQQSQQQLNIPVLVGEWGGGGEGEGFFPHIKYLMNLFDSYRWSNAYFTYTPGLFEQPIMRILSRPYPMAVNGEIKQFHCDDDAKRFTLAFAPSGNAPTVIYLPNGYERVDAGPGAHVALEGKLLRITGCEGNVTVQYN
jgi:endoglycosylceramidase